MSFIVLGTEYINEREPKNVLDRRPLSLWYARRFGISLITAVAVGHISFVLDSHWFPIGNVSG